MKLKTPCFAAAVAGIVPVAALASQPDARPNILFILSDDHTSQTWGIYGGHLADYARTDNIQRLSLIHI
mgnify:FL=1